VFKYLVQCTGLYITMAANRLVEVVLVVAIVHFDFCMSWPTLCVVVMGY